jgi:hypothetical protein
MRAAAACSGPHPRSAILGSPHEIVLFDRDSAATSSRPTVLVHYQYGNQIMGSTLDILSDGTMQHEERSCCPPHSDQITETKLSAEELKQLKGWIRAVAAASETVSQGAPTALGSDSGRLVVPLVHARSHRARD